MNKGRNTLILTQRAIETIYDDNIEVRKEMDEKLGRNEIESKKTG